MGPAGYRRYLSQGVFTEPERARIDRSDLRLDVEPVRVWCQEKLYAGRRESVDDLFSAFEEWGGEGDSAAKKWFGRKVKAALPYASGERRYVTRQRWTRSIKTHRRGGGKSAAMRASH